MKLNILREDTQSVLRGMYALTRQQEKTDYQDRAPISKDFAALYAREILPRLKEGDDIPLRGSNSLGSLASTLVSTRTLELLTLDYPLLKSIATDFSDGIVSFGDTNTTHIVSIPEVQTYNTTTGWPTNSAMTTTPVSITYDQFKGVPISIQAHHLAGTVRNLFEEIAPAQADALGNHIVTFMYNLITPGNFPGVSAGNSATGEAVPTIACGPATFGRSNIIDLGGALDDNKNPQRRRHLLLNRLYYSGLAKDQTIITWAAFQRSEIIEQGVLPDVEGFRVIKAVNLPNTAFAGGKKLKGFAFTRSALVLATRLSADYVNALPGAGNGNLTVVTTPGGFSANQVQYVNHQGANANQRLEIIFGGSAGQPNAGEILTDV